MADIFEIMGKQKPEEKEHLAYLLMKLYFEEIARTGFKKSLSLEEIMNAYFYCLHRLQNTDYEIKKIKIAIENKKLRDLFPDTKLRD